MTIKIPYRGIIEITGDHDVGKTIAALQTTNNMKDVVFVDDDVKGDGTVRQMKEAGMDFDLYIDLSQARAKLSKTPTADELLQVVMDTVEKINEKKRKIIVWDTWRIVYQAARGHVERNQQKYSNVVRWQGNSTIIQGLISKVARMIEVKILNELKANCDLLIITHHIKDRYEGGVIVGKVPESSATFSEVCNMRLWLRRNPQSKVPVILFLKRPNQPKIVSGQLRFVNIVPLKITCTDKHQSIWDAIGEYEEKPIESRSPREDETPTADELSAISGTLTPEMQSYVRAMIKYNEQLEKDLVEASELQQEEVGRKEESKDDTFPVSAAAMLARAKTELNYNLKDIEAILKMPFSEIAKSYTTDYWLRLVENRDHPLIVVRAEEMAKDESKTKRKK